MDRDFYCGLAAALLSIVAFGSFAVPIKSQAACKVAPNVDPLVLQTYKVGVCFATSWLVLAFIPFRFSYLGLISGLLMVPGGTAGYFGVRNAGLAVSQGIWSALKVLVAFAWGLFMFHEPVRSISGTAVAVICLMIGLVGMSYFAVQKSPGNSVDEDSTLVAQEPLLPELDNPNTPSTTSLWGLSLRTWGIVGAVIDGLYGGSVLVPMHFSKYHGLDFLLSFGVGCWTVVVLVWLFRWMLYSIQAQSFRAGWETLPSLHFTTIGPYAYGVIRLVTLLLNAPESYFVSLSRSFFSLDSATVSWLVSFGALAT
jgi:hypothetical protein